MHIATSSDKIDISSEKKTEEIARKIQKKIKVGDVIFLYGEMGVGKTTFIKYLINHTYVNFLMKKFDKLKKLMMLLMLTFIN